MTTNFYIEPVNVYYDLEIINNDLKGNNAPIPISFTENRSNAYLHKPEDYYMSVVRFEVQTGNSLPVFIPLVQLGQSDINLLIYSVTLTYKNYEQQEYIYFIPDDLTQSLPQPPLDFQDLTSSYYFLSHYQSFINMLNLCFKTCLTNLNNKVIAGGDNLPSLIPPFMEFDPNNFVAILDCDEAGYDLNINNPIKLYMNSPLYNLFNTFPSTVISNNSQNGKNVLLSIFNNNNNNVLNLTNYNVLQTYQEGTTIALWNPIMSIVFTTSLLPIISTNIGQPKIFGVQNPSISTNSNIGNIISDYVVNVDALNRYKPNILYIPSSEYRLISLTGNSPISAIEISAYWKDYYGNLHPLYLNTNCAASIKILFRRKDYNNISL